MKWTFLPAILLALASAPSLPTQAPGTHPPDQKTALTYAVVSVRLAKPDANRAGNPTGAPDYELTDLPDGIRVRGATLAALIGEAYSFTISAPSPQEIEGGPKWLTTERFDIDAKIDEADLAALKAQDAYWDSMANFIASLANRTPTTRMLLLRSVLTDRFQLQVHDQVKELPVYTLLVAKTGSKLKKAADSEHGSLSMGSGEIHAEGAPVSLLPSLLATEMGRPIVDATELPGTYDFTLKWTPGFSGAGEAGGAGPQGPGLLIALQEQLGLRLQAGKGPVHVTVIDHAELPSAN
jgi:uncharacterized protein (TIGR03435 family)